MIGDNLVSTLVASSSKMFNFDGVSLNNAISYRNIVGALQYLTMTRPNLSYVVNQVYQYMYSPIVVHFQYIKWLLWYLIINVVYGIFLHPISSFSLNAFSLGWIS